MVDQAQAAPAAPASDPAAGTSPQGQPASPQSGVPNDPAAFQADYTKKYQELGEQRKAVDADKARVEAEKAAVAAERQRLQSMYQPAPQQQADPLTDQFGPEGAAAIRAQQQTVAQGVYQQLFAAEYTRQEEAGRQKYGEAWSKHDYTDPTTGQRGNAIMDLRCKGLSLEQAWNAMNPVDPAALEQQIKDKVYAEMREKGEATPAAGGSPNPATKGEGHAKTTREAFDQAVSSLSGK